MSTISCQYDLGQGAFIIDISFLFRKDLHETHSHISITLADIRKPGIDFYLDVI